MPQNGRIGFLGAGKMATALAKGFINAGHCSGEGMIASDVSNDALTHFHNVTSAKVTSRNADVSAFARILIIAVKPDQVPGLLQEIRGSLREEHLLISIAAGVSLAKLEALAPEGTRFIRVMPNTPALVGCSASAFALGKSATSDDAQITEQLLNSVGVAMRVKESLLDAVTGLSGSGPAYVYQVIEAMSDGGVAAGLPREVATRLAAQTVLGAARMVLETGEHPGVLKDMVTSPGGTTIEGLHELEKGGVRGAFMNAVRVAAEKSRKLGQS